MMVNFCVVPSNDASAASTLSVVAAGQVSGWSTAVSSVAEEAGCLWTDERRFENRGGEPAGNLDR